MTELATVLVKPPPRVSPILGDYEAERASFSWDRARAQLDGLPGGRGLNIAYEAVERHAAGPGRERVALRWRGRGGRRRDLSFAELAAACRRFANVLASLGVARGDRVFVLAERVPELYVAVLGALELGAVACPLYAAFGPEPIRQRIELGQGRVLVASETLYRRKVAPVRAELATLEHVLLVRAEGGGDLPLRDPADRPRGAGAAALHQRHHRHAQGRDPRPRGGARPPRHRRLGPRPAPRRRVLVHRRPGLGHRHQLRHRRAAHPRRDQRRRRGEFDAEAWYRLIARGARHRLVHRTDRDPHADAAGPELGARFDLSSLRLVASVGEPLNPRRWCGARRRSGLPIHDNWWQTETGGIMIANFPVLDIRPGSMGKPVPGVEAGLVRRREDGAVEEVTSPRRARRARAAAGLALDVPRLPRAGGALPQVLRRRLVPERRPRASRRRRLLLVRRARRRRDQEHGPPDRAVRGRERADRAPCGREAGGHRGARSDRRRAGQGVRRARARSTPSEELRATSTPTRGAGSGPAVAPKEIVAAADLPRTRSGKIMRRLLRARELGLPEGDLSTLEGP
jgi:acetyl-CoA synthetase